MKLSTVYLPDLGLCVGLAALFGFLLMAFLPKLMANVTEKLSPQPKSFLLIAPLLAAITATALYLINNDTQLTVIIWSVIAGIGAVCTLTDFHDHRVPNILAFNQFVLVSVALVIDAFITQNFVGLMWAGICLGAAALLFFLAVLLLNIGAGDLKYIPVVAAALGYVNPWLAVGWILISFALNTLYAIIMFAFSGSDKPKSKLKGAMIPPFYFGLWVLTGMVSVGMISTLTS